jgi:uncharacterized protein (TIGR00255 family)
MIFSMTGYGVAQREAAGQLVVIECKSLNSRGLELTTRLPRSLADRDLTLRTLLTRALQRGKVSLTVEITPLAATASTESTPRLLDSVRLRAAFDELMAAAATLGAPPPADPLALALAMPGVIRRADTTVAVESSEAAAEIALAANELWDATVLPLVQEAVAALEAHRRAEGAALAVELRGYGARIRQLLTEVAAQDPQRIVNVRTRLTTLLAELAQPELINQQRLEQELLYHIEKLDIEEEKVRLTGHLDYYQLLLDDPEPAGKKLGFLAQEIGREINTIGSKANDVTIQHLVVSMKEELEKIKEQINNAL